MTDASDVAAGRPIWNTRVTVIDLVPARSAEEAIRKLTERCEQRGLDVHTDGDDTQNAFVSEPLPPEVEARARADWGPTAPRYKRSTR